MRLWYAFCLLPLFVVSLHDTRSASSRQSVGPGSRLVGETGAYVIFCDLFGCNDGQPACYFHHVFIIMEIM